MPKRYGSVVRRKCGNRLHSEWRSKYRFWVCVFLVFYVIQFLLIFYTPFTEVASASYVNTPTVSNFYVTPLVADNSTVFTYYANYTDLDNQWPAVMQVEIDGTPYNMTWVGGTSPNTTLVYNYSTYLSNGPHNFRIIYNDGNGSSDYKTNITWWPYVTSPSYYSLELRDGIFWPSIGNSTTQITYQVTYFDFNGSSPNYIGVSVGGFNYPMNYINGSNKTGAVYRYNLTLPVGSYQHFFNSSSPPGNFFRLPKTMNYTGPTIIDTYLTSGSVSPSWGFPTDTYTYQVIYKNAQDKPPDNITVNINNVSYTMTYVSGSNRSGAVYEYQTTLFQGNHSYYFNCTGPGNEKARFPESSSEYLGGPRVANTFLRNPGFTPRSGGLDTTFTFYVTYLNKNNSSPSNIWINIDNIYYTMTYVSGSNQTGAIYQYQKKLSGGSHKVFYEAYVFPNDTAILPYDTSGFYWGPMVDATLYSGDVIPGMGHEYTLFNYTVAYKHANGTPPDKAHVCIDGVNYSMEYIPGNFSSGVLFYYNTNLSGEGWHWYNFYFEVDNKTHEWLAGGRTAPYVEISQSSYESYFDGSVNPNFGMEITTEYTYTLTYNLSSYSYPINPGWNTSLKNVQINIGPSGYNMTYIAGDNVTYAEYEYKSKPMKVGSYYYNFSAKIGSLNLTIPSTGNYSGPTVNDANMSIGNGTVDPPSGYLFTVFNFSVNYSFEADLAPTSAWVYIDGVNHTMEEGTGSYYPCKKYWYETPLSEGNHSYFYFFRWDNSTWGNKTSRYPTVGNLTLPSVNKSFVSALKGTVDPAQGNITTFFTYKLTYTNPSGLHKITNVEIYIDGVSYAMMHKSGDNYSSAVYEYKTKLNISTHKYFFTANCGSYFVKLPEKDDYSGPDVIDVMPKLFSGEVTPNVGYENDTEFDFFVFYSDLEGKSPSIAEVWINGSYYEMDYVVGSNLTGAMYSYKTKLPRGNYQYFFNFSDGKNVKRLPATGYYFGPVVSPSSGPLNYPPVLWNGSVTPTAGTNKSYYMYSVYYRDNNSDEPKIAQVFIDDVAYYMTEVDGDYRTGMRYELNTTLSVGEHNYYFYFTDQNDSVGRHPIVGYKSGPSVSIAPNLPPVLFNASVSPTTGDRYTKFTYTVWYKDLDYESPSKKLIYVDGVAHTMRLADYIDYKTGAMYEYKTNLNEAEHKYYFVFSSANQTVRYPKTGSFSGPNVTEPGPGNHAPGLHYGIVTPKEGTVNTTFIYYVYYYDIDNDTPTQHDVVIDGKHYEMTLYTPTDYSNYYGFYRFTTRLSLSNHSYYFIFNDGNLSARLPESGNYSGPVVKEEFEDKSPLLWGGSVSPLKGDTNTEFVYRIYYRDPEGKAPSTSVVYIDGTAKTMKYTNGSYSTNATFEYKTNLSLGGHNYYFLFSDESNTVRAPYLGYIYGPLVSKPNSKPAANAGPDRTYKVGPPTTVYFDGSNSSDPDGDKLTYFWDFGDGYYAKGIKVKHVFNGVGTYNVKLTVSDGRLKDTDNCSIKIIDSGQGKTQGKAPAKEPFKLDKNAAYMTVAGSTIIGAAIAAGIIFGTEWGFYGMLLFFMPLYSRIKGSKILDNFTRGKIYGYIIANPGDHYNSIRSALKLKNGALAYHLQMLERADLIKSQTDGKYKRFYPYEMNVPPRATKLTTMRQNIVEHIKESPGITQNEISDKMGVSHQAISYHLRTLIQLGAVNVEKKGRANHCYPGTHEGILQFPEEEQNEPDWT